MLPALLVGWLVGEYGVAAMLSGLLLGSIGAKIGGTRRMVYLSPGLGIAAGVGASQALAVAVSVGALGIIAGGAIFLVAVAWRTGLSLAAARASA